MIQVLEKFECGTENVSCRPPVRLSMVWSSLLAGSTISFINLEICVSDLLCQHSMFGAFADKVSLNLAHVISCVFLVDPQAA